ncbi:MAG: DciA family protein [Balneolaceae bacterium]
MRFDKPKKLGSELQSFIDRFPNKKKLRQGMVLSVWEEVVGERIAEHTEDLHFEGDKLACKVKNQVWRHEIHANRFNIAKRINQRIKSQVVADIIVRS